MKNAFSVGLYIKVQTVLDYTIRHWFSSTEQSRFRKACRCLEKL